MSKASHKALEMAIAKADEKHKANEKTLAGAQSRLRSAQTTLNTLDAFRGEYANRLRGVTHCNTDSLGNYHRFLGKLSHALQSQKNDVDKAGSTVEDEKREWFASLQRLKAMELLRERRIAAAEHKEKRQEQKQSDEFAARSARRLTPRPR